MEKFKLGRTLRHFVTPSSEVSYIPGDKVLLSRGKVTLNCTGECNGPLEVSNVAQAQKFVFACVSDTYPAKPFNIAGIKSYLVPE